MNILAHLLTTHIVSENPLNRNIASRRQEISLERWDFSHAAGSIESILQKLPTKSIYLSIQPESGNPTLQAGEQIPVICARAIDSLHSPPPLSGFHNTQNNAEQIMTFDDMHYRWDPIREWNGRVFKLQCDIDALNPSDQYLHEYSALYRIEAAKMRTNIQGKLDIRHVSFQFVDPDGEIIDEDFDKDDGLNLGEYVVDLIERYDLENTDAQRATLKRSIRDAFGLERSKRQAEIDAFFRRAGFGRKVLDDIISIKIYPVNISTRTQPELNRYYGKADIIISHHQSLLQHPNFSQQLISKGVSIETNGGIYSPHGKLFILNVFRFIIAIGRCDALVGEIDVDIALQQIHYEPFIEYIENEGHSFTTPESIFAPEGDVTPRDLFPEAVAALMLMIAEKERVPRNQHDLFVNFLFASSDGENSVFCADSDAACLRISKTDSEQLEISFVGRHNEFTPIPGTLLSNYLSRIGTIDTIEHMLVRHGGPVEVGPGSRQGDAAEMIGQDVDDDEPRSDCMKQAILQLPDRVASPEAKRRIEIAFPDNEIAPSRVCGKVNHIARTFLVSKVMEDPHHFAMTSNSAMIGIFQHGQRSHCVAIDGSEGEMGTITDPLEGYGKYDRSKRSLKKLGINEFTNVLEFSRIPPERAMTDKTRKKLQRKLNLPFVRGSAASWNEDQGEENDQENE